MADQRTTALPCAVHRNHAPGPKQNHFHHILPLSWGGADTAENRIVICPTGHANVHLLLQAMRGGAPAWEYLRRFAPSERALARRGYDAWRASS